MAKGDGASLEQHVTDWLNSLRASGRRKTYTATCETRLRRLSHECHWRTLDDINFASFERWRIRPRSYIAHNRRGKSRRRPRMGARTKNHYLEALSCFCNWCVFRGRMTRNPVAGIQRVKTLGDLRRQRRALSEAEAGLLLAAAPTHHRLVYNLVLNTGLRRGELRELRWADIHLDTVPAYIQLRATTTKSGRVDVIPLRSSLAEGLKRARHHASAYARVVPHVPTMKQHRRYLEAAGIPYIDKLGRRVDFHSLRHTFGTFLCNAGIPPREAMVLMRHTDIRLTLQTYANPDALALAGEMEKLPICGYVAQHQPWSESDDLSRLEHLWPALSEDARHAIVALVHSLATPRL